MPLHQNHPFTGCNFLYILSLKPITKSKVTNQLKRRESGKL